MSYTNTVLAVVTANINLLYDHKGKITANRKKSNRAARKNLNSPSRYPEDRTFCTLVELSVADSPLLSRRYTTGLKRTAIAASSRPTRDAIG